MPAAIQSYRGQTQQPVPQTEGELIRCTIESLALKYRLVLVQLEELMGNKIEVLHVVGGGSQNDLLNQMTADACQRPVVAGPVEAAVLGNLLVQVRAGGEIGSLSQIRDVVRASSRLTLYEPGKPSSWDEACEQFNRLLTKGSALDPEKKPA